jgi:hypothetical protein
MSETCPKCGSEPRPGLDSWWQCGTFVELVGDVVIQKGEIIQGDLCEQLAALRSQLAAEKKRVEELCELFECEPDMLKQEIVEARDRADAMIRISGKKCKAAEARAAGLAARVNAVIQRELNLYDDSDAAVVATNALRRVRAALLAPAAEEGAGDGK